MQQAKRISFFLFIGSEGANVKDILSLDSAKVS